MLQVYKHNYGDWTQNWISEYSSSYILLSNPKRIYFRTPISGTFTLGIHNDTGSAISNTTTSTSNISVYQANNTVVQYSSTSGYKWIYLSGKTSLYFYVNAGQTYNINVSATATCNSGYSTSTTVPTSGNNNPLTDGFSVQSGTTSITSPVTGIYAISYPNSSSGAPTITVTTTTTAYTLTIKDDSYNTIDVDLRRSTLDPTYTITVPITLPAQTSELTFYNNSGGAAIEGHWPEIAVPYTGWSIRNYTDGFIKLYSNYSWT